MRYGIAVTADTILSTVEISSTAIGAYIILLQEDSTYIIAAVVLMTSFVATTFKHIQYKCARRWNSPTGRYFTNFLCWGDLLLRL